MTYNLLRTLDAGLHVGIYMQTKKASSGFMKKLLGIFSKV